MVLAYKLATGFVHHPLIEIPSPFINGSNGCLNDHRCQRWAPSSNDRRNAKGVAINRHCSITRAKWRRLEIQTLDIRSNSESWILVQNYHIMVSNYIGLLERSRSLAELVRWSFTSTQIWQIGLSWSRCFRDNVTVWKRQTEACENP